MNLRLAGCILTKDGKILLLHRNTAKRKQWEIPGGKIDEDEDSQATAIREVEEELGVKVEIVRLLGDKEFSEDDFTMHYTWYAASILSGAPQIMEPHTFDDMRYFSPEELRTIFQNLSPNTQNFLNELEAGAIKLEPISE
jgi:8-oxo-dGTP diphosphatase